jgi:hypothetical protein
MILSPLPFWKVSAGALLYTYEVTSTTPKATYSDATGTENTNPVVFDSAGYASIWLNGAYKMILTDGVGATLFDPATVEGTVIRTMDLVNSASNTSTFVEVATVAALKALAAGAATFVLVEGYRSAGDGGGGMFYWSSGATAYDDGVYFRPAANPATGRWIRLFNGNIDPRWFGAYGDNSHNDTAALAAADTYAAAASLNLELNGGKYVMSTDPTFTAPVIFKGTSGLVWTTYALAIMPVISICDDKQHFFYSGGGSVTFPATGTNIKTVWLTGTASPGWTSTDLLAVDAAGAKNITTDDCVVTDRLQVGKGADVASENDITLGDGNVFNVTGTTQVNRILVTGWQVGSIVTLYFTSALTLKHGQTYGSSYAGITLQGAVDLVIAAGDSITICLNTSTTWKEIARSTANSFSVTSTALQTAGNFTETYGTFTFTASVGFTTIPTTRVDYYTRKHSTLSGAPTMVTLSFYQMAATGSSTLAYIEDTTHAIPSAIRPTERLALRAGTCADNGDYVYPAICVLETNGDIYIAMEKVSTTDIIIDANPPGGFGVNNTRGFSSFSVTYPVWP